MKSTTGQGSSSCSSGARPFLRWAGGKQWLAPALAAAVGRTEGRYIEPFLGGGALFFQAHPRKAILGDVNEALVNAYRAVRDHPDLVTRYLRGWGLDAATYYAVRQSEFKSSARRAAQFIYLNRTCWNGLYRVNGDGHFNVPFGRPSRRDPLDIRLLLTASRALQGARIEAASFEVTMELAKAGDFIYCDPPYTLQHENNGFIKYNETLFQWKDQERLARMAGRLADKGCTVVVSNAWHDSLVDMYGGFRAYRLSRASTLGGRGSTRGRSSEALFSTVELENLPSVLAKGASLR
ncbi:MAG: DNA adenine methylase [Actinomycetota bacterium]